MFTGGTIWLLTHGHFGRTERQWVKKGAPLNWTGLLPSSALQPAAEASRRKPRKPLNWVFMYFNCCSLLEIMGFELFGKTFELSLASPLRK